MTPEFQCNPLSHDGSFNRLANELNDRYSLWHTLRVAEMSGQDFVFVPDAICRQISTLRSLSIFLNNLQTVLGSPKSRTKIIGYWYDAHQTQHFEKYSVEWSDDIAIDWRKELLDGSPQLEFIETLFTYSEKLVAEA